MDPLECLADLRDKGHCVIRCVAGTKAESLEKVCRDVFELFEAGGAGGQYNCAGGVTRKTLDGSALLDTREGAPPELAIQFHNEMAYAARFPKYIAFALVHRDVNGTDGCTTLCDNTKVIKTLGGRLVKKMQALGILYTRKLEDVSHRNQPFFYNSWQEAFGTNDRNEALKRGNAANNSILFETSYSDRYSMTHITWCPLFQSEHPIFGETLFSSILNWHG